MNDASKQAALCQALAVAARRELAQDFNKLAADLEPIRTELEQTRAELAALRDLLAASQLIKKQRAQKREAAKLRQARQRTPPPLETEDGATDPAAAAAVPAFPSNAMLYFVKMLVDNVEGARAETLEDLPDADAVRSLAEMATKNDRAKLSALAEKWSGNGSELFPADWRALGRSAWKTFAQEKQDAIRIAFRAARAGSA